MVLSEAVKEVFGSSISIVNKSNISGGCINSCYLLNLSNNLKVFVKINSLDFFGMFEAEALGLQHLHCDSGTRTVKVYDTVEVGEKQFLFLEYIQQSVKKNSFYKDFGISLAMLHNSKSSDSYGFLKHNFIGSTIQKNTNMDSWINFFKTNRLLFQVYLAQQNNYADTSLVRDVEKLCDKLPDLLPEPDKPYLIHGDLWSGNYITDEKGNAVLIDPAVYYGHYEAELAMTELFGTLPDIFYSAYSEVLPIEKSYHQRKDLYNLYHMLNHLNIFGSSYYSSCLQIVKHYL